MRSALVLMTALLLPSRVFGSLEAFNPTKSFARLVREADGAVIEYGSRDDNGVAIFEDAGWRERLAVLLEKASYKPQAHCFCISYPDLRLVSKDKVLLQLSLHHGTRLRGYGGGGGGDFLVGSDACAAITALINEKPPAVKKPKQPQRKVPPPVVLEKTP